MLKLVAGLMIFLGVHSIRIFAPQWRERMIARIGAGPWKVIYSLASLAGFLLIVGGYAAARLRRQRSAPAGGAAAARPASAVRRDRRGTWARRR